MDEIKTRQIKLALQLLGIMIVFIVVCLFVCTNGFKKKYAKLSGDILSSGDIEMIISNIKENDPEADIDEIRAELISLVKGDETEIKSDYVLKILGNSGDIVFLEDVSGDKSGETSGEAVTQEPVEVPTEVASGEVAESITSGEEIIEIKPEE